MGRRAMVGVLSALQVIQMEMDMWMWVVLAGVAGVAAWWFFVKKDD